MYPKNKLIVTAVCLVFLLMVILGRARRQNAALPSPAQTPQEARRIKVLASNYTPYILAKAALKGAADVSMLTRPGEEMHTFEPSAQDIIKIKEAPFFFFIDYSMAPWMKAFDEDNVYPAVQNLPEVIDGDPHVWLNLDNAYAMASNIAQAVEEKYPSAQETLFKNDLNFQNELSLLKRMYAKKLSNCKTRDVYHIGHKAFGYLAKEFNLNFKPLSGVSSQGQEPAVKDLALMIKEIKDNDIRYIFSEEALPPDFANLIEKETGAKPLMLYTIEHISKEDFDKQVSYTALMKRNLDALVLGLSCQGQKDDGAL